ncbi:MAG: hypothetical protein IKF71_03545 [Bacilli bacterium]|nr:hypothetical protein [Bacilli bacterium]
MNVGILLGIAVAVAITSMRNEKMVKEYRKKQKLEALKKPVELKLEPAKVEKLEKKKKSQKKKD